MSNLGVMGVVAVFMLHMIYGAVADATLGPLQAAA
jgi:hypothetical protein